VLAPAVLAPDLGSATWRTYGRCVAPRCAAYDRNARKGVRLPVVLDLDPWESRSLVLVPVA
jgi:hypothetical protein